jgi:hypothetical protein
MMRRKLGALWGKGWAPLLMFLSLNPLASPAQSTTSSGGVQAAPAQVTSSTYQGSIVKQAPVPGVLPLSLDQAIRMGLQYNQRQFGRRAAAAAAAGPAAHGHCVRQRSRAADEPAGGRTQISWLCGHWTLRLHRRSGLGAGVAFESVFPAKLSGFQA